MFEMSIVLNLELLSAYHYRRANVNVVYLVPINMMRYWAILIVTDIGRTELL